MPDLSVNRPRLSGITLPAARPIAISLNASRLPLAGDSLLLSRAQRPEPAVAGPIAVAPEMSPDELQKFVRITRDMVANPTTPHASACLLGLNALKRVDAHYHGKDTVTRLGLATCADGVVENVAQRRAMLRLILDQLSSPTRASRETTFELGTKLIDTAHPAARFDPGPLLEDQFIHFENGPPPELKVISEKDYRRVRTLDFISPADAVISQNNAAAVSRAVLEVLRQDPGGQADRAVITRGLAELQAIPAAEVSRYNVFYRRDFYPGRHGGIHLVKGLLAALRSCAPGQPVDTAKLAADAAVRQKVSESHFAAFGALYLIQERANSSACKQLATLALDSARAQPDDANKIVTVALSTLRTLPADQSVNDQPCAMYGLALLKLDLIPAAISVLEFLSTKGSDEICRELAASAYAAAIENPNDAKAIATQTLSAIRDLSTDPVFDERTFAAGSLAALVRDKNVAAAQGALRTLNTRSQSEVSRKLAQDTLDAAIKNPGDAYDLLQAILSQFAAGVPG